MIIVNVPNNQITTIEPKIRDYFIGKDWVYTVIGFEPVEGAQNFISVSTDPSDSDFDEMHYGSLMNHLED